MASGTYPDSGSISPASASNAGSMSAADFTKLSSFYARSSANLGDADVTVQPQTDLIGQYVMPAGTTTAARTITVGKASSPAPTRVVVFYIFAQGHDVIFIDDASVPIRTVTAGTKQAITVYYTGTHFALSDYNYLA